MFIKEAYVDLRSKRFIANKEKRRDLNRLTQGLYGESVDVLGVKEEWAYVELLSQKKYKGEHWEGYRGWVLKEKLTEDPGFHGEKFVVINVLKAKIKPELGSALTLGWGVKLPLISEEAKLYRVKLLGGIEATISKKDAICPPLENPREKILDLYEPFLKMPYFWGGLTSIEEKELPWGTDCSGLIYLLFSLFNVKCPRDSIDQYLASHEVKKLEAGDLIFYSKSQMPGKIEHVMLSLGGEKVLEASAIPGYVHTFEFKELFGQTLSETKSGDKVIKKSFSDEKTIYFGSLFP